MGSSTAMTVNHVILLVKSYIYTCKYQEKLPEMKHFKEYVKYIEKLEKTIATKNRKLVKHKEKWNTILSEM